MNRIISAITFCMLCVSLSAQVAVTTSVVDLDPETPLSGSVELNVSGGTPPYTLYLTTGSISFPTDTVHTLTGLDAGEFSAIVVDDLNDTAFIDETIAYQIAWRNNIGCTITSTGVYKTSTNGYNYDAGVSSFNTLSAYSDGYVENDVLSTNATRVRYGLTVVDVDHTSIKYSIAQDLTTAYFYHNTTVLGTTSVTAGDVTRVAREGSYIKYYLNGVEQYSVSIDASEELIIDLIIRDDNINSPFSFRTSMDIPYGDHGTLTHAIPDSTLGEIALDIRGGEAPYTYLWSTSDTTATLSELTPGTYSVTVTDDNSTTMTKSFVVAYQIDFTNVAGATVTGTSFTRDGGGSLYANGAWSNNVLRSGDDGYIEWTVAQDISRVSVGLSRYDTDSTHLTMEYAMVANSDGTIYLYTNGVGVGVIGGYEMGDVLKMERVSSVLYFMRNGVVLDTFFVDPTEELHLDISAARVHPIVNISTSFGIDYNAYSTVVHNKVDTIPCGSIDVRPRGGKAPYTYLWSDSNTDGYRTGLAAGEYTVTVTDDNSATFTKSYSVNYQIEWINEVQVSTTGTTLQRDPYGSAYDRGAFSSNVLRAEDDGFVEFRLSSSSSKIVFGLSTFDHDATATMILYKVWAYNIGQILYSYDSISSYRQVGNYKIGDIIRIEKKGSKLYYFLDGEVVDSIHVSLQDDLHLDVSVGGSAPLVGISASFGIDLNAYPIIKHCHVDTLESGSIDVNARGGTAPYSYSWSDGGTGAVRSDLATGTYTVTITDDNALTVSRSIEIGYQLEWQNEVNVEGTAYGLEKVSGNNYNYDYDAGASTANRLAPYQNGYFTFTPYTNAALFNIGFSIKDLDQKISQLKYDLALMVGNGFSFLDGLGNVVYSGVYPTGSVFKLERVDTTMQLFLNGELVVSYTVDPSESLVIDNSIRQIGYGMTNMFTNIGVPFDVYPNIVQCSANDGKDGVIDLNIRGGVPPYTYLWSEGYSGDSVGSLTAGTYYVTITDSDDNIIERTVELGYQLAWTDTVNVNVGTDFIRKVANINSYVINAGGVSWNRLAPHQDGYFQFDVSRVSFAYSFFGLSCDRPKNEADNFYTDQSYGFYFNNGFCRTLSNGIGVVDTSYAYGPGSTFRMGREGSTLYYIIDTDTVKTIAVSPDQVLYFDGAFQGGGDFLFNMRTNFPYLVDGNATVVHDDPNTPKQGKILLNTHGGIGPYTYEWNDGTTADSLVGLGAGDYSVTITDANGTSVEESYKLLYFIQWQDTLYVTTGNGWIEKALYGGSYTGGGASVNKLLPYTNGYIEFKYSSIDLTLGFGLSDEDVNLGHGSIDKLFYIYGGNVLIKGGSIDFTSQEEAAQLGSWYRTERVNDSIYFKIDGEIVYADTTDPATELLIDLSITNALGVPVEVRTTIGAPLSVNAIISDPTVEMPNSGAVTVTGIGGVAPYSYEWSTTSTSNSLSGLSEGLYTVTVTDALGNTFDSIIKLYPDAYYWIGATDADWDDPNNWSLDPGGAPTVSVPTSGSVVVVSGLTVPFPELGSNVTVQRLIYTDTLVGFIDQSVYTLTVTEKTFIDGMDIELGSDTLSLSGDWGFGQVTVTLSGGVIVSDGTLNFYGGEVSGYGELNTGGLELAGGLLTVSGGLISVDSDLTISAGELSSASDSLVVDGALRLSGGSMSMGTGYLSLSDTMSMTGGEFDGESAEILCAEALLLDGGSFVSTSEVLKVGGSLTGLGSAFSHNNGLVELYGNNVTISLPPDSTVNTSTLAIEIGGGFYDVEFTGTGYTKQLNNELYVLHYLDLNDNILDQNNSTLILASDSATALRVDGGGILTYNENNDAFVKWAVGTSMGTFEIPYIDDSSNYLSMSYTIDTVGVVKNPDQPSYLLFSMYPATSAMLPMPDGVYHLLDTSDTENTDLFMRRYWYYGTENYKIGPLGDMEMHYRDLDYDGLLVTESQLNPHLWGELGWEQWHGTLNTTLNTITIRPPRGGPYVMYPGQLVAKGYYAYAQLKEKLDGSYHSTFGSKVHIKYRNPYSTEDVTINVYSWDRSSWSTQETVKPGNNWLEIDLASAGLTEDSYYVLELVNGKGQKQKIRIKYVNRGILPSDLGSYNGASTGQGGGAGGQ